MTTKKKSAPKTGEKSKKTTTTMTRAPKALTEPTATAVSVPAKEVSAAGVK